MDEETRENKSPIRNRYKLYKYLTVALFLVVVFFSIGAITVETTSTSKFCSTCHEMQPEYYTWKASSHSEVDCVQCHIKSGVDEYAKAKANGLVEVYKKTTNSYTAPIQMPKEIPDSSCEKCHNMKNRNVSTSGDLIIPHDKHRDEDVKCVQCHAGVAHGKIAERKITFKADYEKWDDSLGKSMMKDGKFVSPTMEKCMDCHQSRNITTECKSCHSTAMYPESHRNEVFKSGAHGLDANKDVRECHDCHKYMMENEVNLFNEQPAYTQFLQNKTVEKKKVSSHDYAKENTYCLECHTTKRPVSHKVGFINNHGAAANEDKSTCLTCHEQQNTGQNKTKTITCSTCHPASHKNKEWRVSHPVPLSEDAKLTDSCYRCHSETKCEKCHRKE